MYAPLQKVDLNSMKGEAGQTSVNYDMVLVFKEQLILESPVEALGFRLSKMETDVPSFSCAKENIRRKKHPFPSWLAWSSCAK